eukprot:gene4210-5984_t
MAVRLTDIKQTLSTIKKNLEKSIKDSSNTVDYEYLSDILNELHDIVMTPDLIKDSKLGKVLTNLKEKCERGIEQTKESNENESRKINDTLARTKEILIKWKTIMSHAQSVNSSKSQTQNEKFNQQNPTVNNDSNNQTFKISLKSPNLTMKERTPLQSYDNMTDLKQLPQNRKSIVNIFTNILKNNSKDAVLVNRVSLMIEDKLNQYHPTNKQNTYKLYTDKAKSLSFNLRTNKDLSQHVLTGEISVDDLVTKSATEIAATREQRLAREKESYDSAESRRLDWFEENKAEILQQSGIDPNNTWDYDEDANSEDSVPGED